MSTEVVFRRKLQQTITENAETFVKRKLESFHTGVENTRQRTFTEHMLAWVVRTLRS